MATGAGVALSSLLFSSCTTEYAGPPPYAYNGPGETYNSGQTVQNYAPGQNYPAQNYAPGYAQEPTANPTPPGTLGAEQGNGDWPREFVTGTTTNIVYQPQIESWDGYTLKARNAVAVETPDHPQPVYGVIEVQANTVVNKTERLVEIENCRILSVDFPSNPGRQQDYLTELRESFPQEFQNVSLDRLEASLAATQQEQTAAQEPLDNAPPQIIFANRPSVLVYIDGPPAYRPVAGTDLSRVINTRVLLLKDNQTGYLYLHILNGYLSAPGLSGPWTLAAAPPGASVAEEQARHSQNVDLLEGQPDPNTGAMPQLAASTAPSVYVSTQPAELITFNGQPDFVAIPGTHLLYVSNTTGYVFKLLTTQQDYVLISGRWYSSPSLNGPWQFVPANQLPADFADIPDSSPKENVKASIAGTAQAQEAVIENSVPQTSRVARDTQIQPPQFDGPPQMTPIPGTPLNYVANSDTPIVEVAPQSWFACQSGVWFTSPSVNGPWVVADSVPSVIYSIPPSCPLYYVTFVHIYNSTPEYVYEGYTPGYLGAMVAPDDTVVYGTGYDYQPWIGDVWFGPPVTWGLGCDLVWNPWYGWDFDFGLGWLWGDYAAGWWWHPPAPWWGPYRHWGHESWGRMAAWGPGGWAHTGLDIYHHHFGRAGAYNTFGMNRWHGVYGRSYNSRTGELSAGHRAQVGNVFNRQGFNGNRGYAFNGRNNAFATRNGGVFLRNNNGGWRSVTPSRSFSGSTFSMLGRENSAREMGNQHFNAFRNTFPSGGFHGESGAARAFGGARSPGGFGGGHGFGGGGGGRHR